MKFIHVMIFYSSSTVIHNIIDRPDRFVILTSVNCTVYCCTVQKTVGIYCMDDLNLGIWGWVLMYAVSIRDFYLELLRASSFNPLHGQCIHRK